MNFSSKAIPMSRQGIAKALERLRVSPGESALLWAVFEVETAGVTQGFGFRNDRRPQLLFERHVFRKQTAGRFNKVAPDISGPAGGYGSIAVQYDKLNRAIDLCEGAGLGLEPALRSASWGLGQVMGFNHEVAGYSTATKMVEAMVADEDAQLLASIEFMVENHLDSALRSRDWSGFAKIYNGAGYAVNHYDLKLEQAYSRFSSGSGPNLEVRSMQAALLLLGFSPGKIDGVLGRRTRDALTNFQVSHNLTASGELTPDAFAALWKAAFS